MLTIGQHMQKLFTASMIFMSLLSPISSYGGEPLSDLNALTIKAEHGDINAQHDLGSAYVSGRGVTQNYASALKWTLKAAEQGDARSQNNMGVMYDLGLGVKKDQIAAAKWYQRALKTAQPLARQGNPNAQLLLGIIYELGHGVKRDAVEAARWLHKAAEQGNADAQREFENLNNSRHRISNTNQ
jgi:hypothetical protein